MNKRLISSLLIPVTLFLSFTLSGFTFPESSDKERAAWPLPPEETRISYVMTIEKPKDIGIKKSFFKRVVEIFTGKEPEPKIHRPSGVISDGNGKVYVSDTGLQVIHVFDYKNKLYKQIFKLQNEPPPGRLLSPIGLALDKEENLYVSDSILKKVFVFAKTGNHKIWVYNIIEKSISSFGERGGAHGKFNFPTHMAVDSKGDIYITDEIGRASCRER